MLVCCSYSADLDFKTVTPKVLEKADTRIEARKEVKKTLEKRCVGLCVVSWCQRLIRRVVPSQLPRARKEHPWRSVPVHQVAVLSARRCHETPSSATLGGALAFSTHAPQVQGLCGAMESANWATVALLCRCWKQSALFCWFSARRAAPAQPLASRMGQEHDNTARDDSCMFAGDRQVADSTHSHFQTHFSALLTLILAASRVDRCDVCRIAVLPEPSGASLR